MDIPLNIIQIVQQIGQVAIIVYGFHLFIEQTITMGAIIAVAFYKAVHSLLPKSLKHSAAQMPFGLSKPKSFLSAPRMATVEQSTASIFHREKIKISNVTLRLSESAPPFCSLNISIKRGEKVAVSGKRLGKTY